MSRPLWVTLAIALGIPSLASGQSAAGFRDSAIRLTASIRALRDSLLDRDSSVAEVTRRAALVIGASPRQRRVASTAFEAFVTARTRWFGSSVPSPSGFRIVVRNLWGYETFSRFGGGIRKEDQVVLTGLPDTANSVRLERGAKPAEVGAVLIQAYTEMMFRGLGARMQRWLVDPPPVTMDEQQRRYLAMYSVMTSTGKAQRGCRDGRAEYCAFALGLRPGPSPELTGTYSRLARFDFFLTALGVGGAEAWSRLAAAGPARAEDALSAAARVPIDSLLAAWRNGIVGLRPEETPLPAGGALLIAGWAAGILLGTLAVSRWR